MSMDANPNQTISDDPTVFPPSASAGPLAGSSGTDAKPESNEKPYKSAGGFTAALLGLVLVALLIIFLAQNTDNVDISFLNMDGSAALAIVILVTAFVAVVADQLFSFMFRHRRRKIRNERAELRRMKKH